MDSAAGRGGKAGSVSGACACSLLVLPGVAGELVLEFVLLDEEQYVRYEKYPGE